MFEHKGSVSRSMAILKLLARHQSGMKLKDIASELSLPSSSVHRLLQTLVQSGLAERGEQQIYRAGPDLYHIAWIIRSRFDLVTLSRPFLERLWRAYDETAVLAAYNRAHRTATIIDTILTSHPLRHAMEVGMELELPWGSIGKSILAYLSDDDIRIVLANASVGPLSGQPLPANDVILEELEDIRRDKCAVYSDSNNDVAGVSAPVFLPNREIVGCIGLTMPAVRRARHDLDNMSAAVRESAIELTKLIEFSTTS
ncbi:IclR family transcriptional regulator [Hyphococcus luteus]|jgi:DNA-binding IclR family transcriptional regulator|uniref:IclR family transcriptional regulator n=1 Tax=Hyphococcus luteus TaxID=2058213 RepID=A0A2S7K547_9PROT|nr:IclR family transcriptional regulator [Marinicaulis flavus]PQA87596.1 hypothetical protein CW354_10980 [Marinicaulis flavus]